MNWLTESTRYGVSGSLFGFSSDEDKVRGVGSEGAIFESLVESGDIAVVLKARKSPFIVERADSDWGGYIETCLMNPSGDSGSCERSHDHQG